MSELVDLVDRFGQTKKPRVPRHEACANQDPDLFVPIAIAVVFNGLGEVLVQQRSWGKMVDDGKLDFVCGIVSSGEDPALTAVREAEEEADVSPINIRKIAEGVNVYRKYRHLFVGSTDRTGMTVPTPNNEVEWAGMMNPFYVDLLITKGFYEPVGDFYAHLSKAVSEVGDSKTSLSERPLV